MSEHIELTEPCGLLTVPGVREYVCRLEPVGEGAVNVTVCAPTEPVVRCRDCKEFTFGNAEYATVDWCDYWDAFVESPDGFCSWGERRDA